MPHDLDHLIAFYFSLSVLSVLHVQGRYTHKNTLNIIFNSKKTELSYNC